MQTFRLGGDQFLEVADPLGDTGEPLASAFEKAGYVKAVSSELGTSDGAEVSLYSRDEAPRFYIDLMGTHVSIGAVVADDFPHLVRTLKELHPLLTLIQLDQAASIQASKQLERDEVVRRGK